MKKGKKRGLVQGVLQLEKETETNRFGLMVTCALCMCVCCTRWIVSGYIGRHPRRWVFRDRGDVWRLARSIGQALESRTWPSSDRANVKHLLDFVHTVTGRKPVAFFADALPSAEALPATKSLPARVLGVGGWLFFVRWLRVMYVGGMLKVWQ